jgi:hypothetical protein
MNSGPVARSQLGQQLKKHMVNQYQNQISSIQQLFPTRQLKPQDIDAGEYASMLR